MAKRRRKQPEASAPAAGAPPKKISAAREYLVSIVVTAVLALFGTTTIVQAFKIPSSSMEDTLLIGDHLLVDKISYAPSGFWHWMLPYQTLERDRIIVLRDPKDSQTYLVKRLIGLPGDRIHLANKQVFRNGVRLDEPYVHHSDEAMDDFRDDFPNWSGNTAAGGASIALARWMSALPSYVHDGEIVVPEGQYFVMGDNRDLSFDSRYWGFVPRENIIGKPLFIYWSYESSAADYVETGTGGAVAGWIEALVHFPTKTRWGRMFRMAH
jgi:signal peptidase I